MIKLYQHQQVMIDELRASLKKYKSVLLQGATGIGKTAIASFMVKGAIEKGRSVVFQVHRKELLQQVAKTFDRYEIPYGFIASDKPYDNGYPCHIAIVNTLRNRREKMLPPDLLIVDECHMSASKSWSDVVQWAKEGGGFVIGLTATPVRFDGKGLKCHFDAMVTGNPMAELIENKYLSAYRYFAPTGIDTSKFHIKHGDYDIREVEEAALNPQLVGNAVENYVKYASGKRAIVFAPTIKVSKALVASFNEAGIDAIHLDSKMSSLARQGAITGFAEGQYKILSNVSIMVEGFDLSSYAGYEVPIEACIIYTATVSTSRYLQMIGRALRPKPEPAIIIDHGANHSRHGLPADDRDWKRVETTKRESKKKSSDDEEKIKQCESCYCVYEAKNQACPECGHVNKAKDRKIKTVDGELSEITKAPKKLAYSTLERKARDNYKQMALDRGYKPGWVFYKMQAWRAKHGFGE